MVVRVQKWGNSLAIRIPSSYAKDAGFAEGTEADISVTGKKIIMKPLIREYDLHKLILRINPDNIHKEIETDGPVGNEIW